MRQAKTKRMLAKEAQLGMSLERYFAGSHKRQVDMAAELGVTKATVNAWIARLGLAHQPAYQRR